MDLLSLVTGHSRASKVTPSGSLHMTELLKAKEKNIGAPSGQIERLRPERGQSTVATNEVYKCQRFRGASSSTTVPVPVQIVPHMATVLWSRF